MGEFSNPVLFERVYDGKDKMCALKALFGFTHTGLPVCEHGLIGPRCYDGKAMAVGDNFHGQCRMPLLPEGVEYVSAAAGDSHTILLRSDGQVETCGDNANEQCLIPALPDGVVYTVIAAGSHHSLLIRSDGTAVACGYNDHGQCTVRTPER